MKVIDLLNKIANNGVSDEIQHIKYFDRNAEENDICMLCYENLIYKLNCGQLDINDEVEIIEEEKKIPEKLPYYSMEKIQKAKNKDEWREERITLLEKRVEDLHIKMNDLLDYLKSKGE